VHTTAGASVKALVREDPAGPARPRSEIARVISGS